MKENDESVSVVIPVFNERPAVESVLRDLLESVADAVPGSEIVAVDDGSTDGTLAALRSIAGRDPRLKVIAAQRNRGHGPTLMTALDAATRPWLLLVDADGQIPARHFLELWSRRKDLDLVMGRRDVRHDARYRVLLSRILEKVVSRLTRKQMEDPNVPFKLVRRDLWLDLRPHMDHEARVPSLMIALGAELRGWRTVSVHVDHLPRPHGRSKLRAGRLLRLGIGTLLDLVALRRRLKRAVPRRTTDELLETPAATLPK